MIHTEILEELEEAAAKTTGRRSCGDCGSGATRWYCDCRRNICDTCTVKHGNIRHKNTTICDELFCNSHHNDVNTHYCHNCDVTVCEFCPHRDHNLVTVVKGEQSHRDMLEVKVTTSHQDINGIYPDTKNEVKVRPLLDLIT